MERFLGCYSADSLSSIVTLSEDMNYDTWKAKKDNSVVLFWKWSVSELCLKSLWYSILQEVEINSHNLEEGLAQWLDSNRQKWWGESQLRLTYKKVEASLFSIFSQIPPAEWHQPQSHEVIQERMCGEIWGLQSTAKRIWGWPTTMWVILEGFSPDPAEPWPWPQLTASLQPHEGPWTRTTQLSCSKIPDPLKPRDSVCLLSCQI